MKKKNDHPASNVELRHQAEKKLSERKKKDGASIVAEADTQRLVHELQVHQIELEMQNEELAQTRATAKKLLHQYSDLYDFAPVGYFTLARNSAIRQANLNGAHLLGVERDALINRHFLLFITAEFRPVFNAFLEKTATSREKENCEVALSKNGNELIWVDVEATCSEDGQEFRTVVVDITEKRRQAESAMSANETRYHSLFEDSPIALWEEDFSAVKQHLSSLRDQGITNFQEYLTLHPQAVIECATLIKVLDVNHATMKLFGTNKKDDLLKNLAEFLKGEPLQQFQNELVNIAKGMTSFGWEGVIKSLDGRLKNIDLSWQAVRGYENTLSRVIVSMIDITERKETEQELHNAEQLFRELVDNIEEVFWITEPVSKKDVYVSPAYKKVWGQSLKDVDDFVKSIQPEDQPVVINALEKQKRGEKTEIEYRIQHVDGSVRWIWDRAFPIYDASGRLKSVAGIAGDITERKQAQEALLTSESSLQGILQSTADGILAVSLENKVLFANEHFAKMWKIPQDIIASKDDAVLLQFVLDQLTHPQDFINKVQELYASRQESFDVLYFKDGRIFERLSKPIVTGEKTTGRVWSFRDITERKKIEAALLESEHAHRTLFENVPVGLYRTTIDGRILDANPALVRMFGYQDRESFLAMKTDDLYVDPVTNREFNNVLVRSDIDTSLEAEYYKKDGTTFWAEDHIRVIRDEDGNPLFYEGSLIDITERKRAAQALAESEERFRQAITAADAIPYSLNYESDHYTFIGDGITKLAGYPLEEMTPALLDSLIVESIMHGNFEGVPLDDAVRLVREGKSGIFWRCDHRIRTRSGDERWISDSSVQVLDENGIPKGSIGIIQDITERKQIEAAAREGEARYRSLFEDSPVALWEEDFSAVKFRLDALRDEGIQDFRAYFAAHPQMVFEYISLVKIVDVNKAALNLFGAKEKVDLLQSLTQLIDSDSAQLFQNELISIAQGKTHFEWEGVNKTLDGRQIIIRLSLSVLPGCEDTFSKVIISMVDVTTHIQAEKAIRESEKSLRESQMIAGLGSYTLDVPSGKWTSSDILNQIFGIDESILSNGSFTHSVENWIALVHPDWQKKMSDYFANEVLGNHIRFDKEYKIVRKNDGAERWVHGLGELEFNAQNQPVKMRGTIQDITQRKLAEEILEQRARELDTLYNSAMTISSNLSLEVVLNTVVEQMTKAVHTDGCALSFWDQERDFVITMADFRLIALDGVDAPGKIYSLKDYPATRRALETRELLLLSRNNPQIDQAELDLMNEQGMDMVLLLPLVVRDQVIGLMELYEIENKGRIFTADEIRLAHSLSAQIAVFIENARLYQNAQLELAERKRAEQQMQALIEAMPDGVLVADTEGNIIVANTQSEALFGYRQDELLGRPIEMLIPERVRNIHARHRDDYLAAPKMRTMGIEREIYARRQDGSEFPVNISLNTVETEQGRIVISVIRDITERKQAEEALRKSEQRYRALFEDMPVAIWEEDFSDVKKHLDSLKKQGVTDFRAYFASHPDTAVKWFNKIRIMDVNNMAVAMYQAENKEQLIEFTNQGISKGELEYANEFLMHIADGKTSHSWEGIDETFAGESIETNLSWSVAPGYEHDFSKVIVTTLDITERKRTEEALRTSEEKYRLIIENAGEALYVVQNGLIVFVNPMFEKIAELSASELIGSSIMEFIPAQEDRMGAMKSHLRLLSGKIANAHREFKVRLRSGTERWIDVNEVRTIWEGEPAALTFATDITERKQSEEAVQKSEKRFRALIANAGDLIVVIDSQGIIQFASPSSERILGYSPEEAVGRNFTEWVHPGDLAEVLESLASRSEEPGVAIESIKTRSKHKNGSWRILDTIGTNLINEPAIQGIVLNIRDITERELTEEALKASEAQFRAIFEGAAIGIALLNPLGHPVKVNSSLEEMLGYDARELCSMVFTDFTHPDDIMADWTLWQELVEGKRDHYHIEKRFIHKNGSILWGKLTSSIIPGADGKILFGVGMVEDITERKKAEAENKYQLSELEALYENGLAISRLLEPKRIAQRMVEVIDQKLDWHHAAIRLYDASTDRLELLALNFPGFNEAQIAEQIERINQTINTPDKGLSGWVIRHGEVIRIGNLKDDPRYLETYAGINSGLYVPIKSGEDVIGSIAIESEQENAFTERDEHTLTTLANQAAISFINARLYFIVQKELDERHRAEEEVRKLNVELEHRVAERTAQIEATKRRLELATHAGQIGVWEYVPRENKVIWDERMHMIHQIPAGEFDGTSQMWARLVHPHDLEKSQLNKQLAFTQNLLFNNEHRIILPDGSIRHINTSSVMVFSEDGTAERVIGISMDITERKQIEQSLRESENYARLLFDAVADPVSVTERNALIVDVNKAFENQYNLMRDEIRGKRISDLGIYPETELEKREKYLSKILQGQPAKPIELDFYVPGDRIHTLELHSYLLKVNDRDLVLNSAHDITSHKKAEETQRLAKSEMERALRIKNEFLANMSHELRTPLNSILGISESLEEQIAGTLNEKQLKYIGIVRESGRHLLELINDILDLSKIEAGRMELDIHKISVEMLCQSSLRMIKELSQKKSLHVSFKVKGDIKIILADQRRIKQSLVNLLSNAVKFTPDGKEIGLEVEGNTQTNEVEFTVWDQGVGITQENTKLLFKPFVQLDAGLAREYQGTGLGLALVAQMIHLHGGRVRVESEVGKGSRFIITLPWLADEQTPKAKVTAKLVFPSPASDEKRSGRILLVEDTDVVVQLISEYLRYKGYEILLAHNGVDAIKLAAQEHPDLILMDVMMPIMDGLEATRRIRTDQTLQNIPIIALTALAMSGDSERCLAAGMNDYISKPIQMQELTNMIEKYLEPTRKQSNGQ